MTIDAAGMNCPICRSPTVTTAFVAKSPWAQAREPYPVRDCGACGHRWCEGDISPALLTSIYAGAFHDSAQQSAGASGAIDDNAPILANALARAHALRKRGLNGDLLDVGAGNGYFVLAANRAGFDASGIELSPDAAERAKAIGARVAAGDFQKSDGYSSGRDVVTPWDVLAGMTDPHATAEKIASNLKPGGHCVLTLPNRGALIARLTGSRWPLMIPPVNLHFFSRRSIEVLLQAHGMALLDWRAEGKKVAVRFAAQKLARALSAKWLERLFVRTIPEHWALRLNLGDIVTVIARREPA